VDGLYDSIEVDPALRPLFGRDLATERESQKRFFTHWLGATANLTRAVIDLDHHRDGLRSRATPAALRPKRPALGRRRTLSWCLMRP
jgi:truncated hemoglobin YjbI